MMTPRYFEDRFLGKRECENKFSDDDRSLVKGKFLDNVIIAIISLGNEYELSLNMLGELIRHYNFNGSYS